MKTVFASLILASVMTGLAGGAEDLYSCRHHAPIAESCRRRRRKITKEWLKWRPGKSGDSLDIKSVWSEFE